MSCTLNYTLTPKFEKELLLFFKWANAHYTIFNNKNEKISWNKNMLVDFNETPRKKLDGYLKNVFNIYIVKNDQDVITSYIDILSKYKDQKNIKPNSSNQTEINKVNTTLQNQLSVINDSETLSTQESTPENTTFNIVINNDLNTENIGWICNLDYTTEQLVKHFGNPIFSGNNNTKHRYEWKFSITTNTTTTTTTATFIFSIYDWKFDDPQFYDIEETDWYLCGNNKDTDMTLKIIKSLDKIILN